MENLGCSDFNVSVYPCTETFAANALIKTIKSETVAIVNLY